MKQLFLLPSLLLANAYLLIGMGSISPNAEPTAYSETIKMQDDLTYEQVSSVAANGSLSTQVETPNNESVFSHYDIASSVLLSIISLSFYYLNLKKSNNKDFKSNILSVNNSSKLILKKQSFVFNIIQAFQTSFHCVYFKLITSSIHS